MFSKYVALSNEQGHFVLNEDLYVVNGGVTRWDHVLIGPSHVPTAKFNISTKIPSSRSFESSQL